MTTVYRIWWIALIVKLVIGIAIPIGGDEAYYWVWSRYLDWSYYDHPPMVAWMHLLSPYVPGYEGLIRWPGVIIAHLSLLFWIDLLKSRVSSTQILWFLLLILACPLTGIGSIVITPDIPLMFFGSLVVWLVPRVVEDGALKNYVFLGLALGFAFLSKYSAVLFAPPILLYITFAGKWHQVRGLGVLLSVTSGLIACLPVLYWNMTNEWISFGFQLDHGLGGTEWDPEWTTTYLLALLITGFPSTYYLAFKRQKSKADIFFWFALFPLIFFLFTSFRGKVEANWPLIAFPPLFALAVTHSERVTSHLTAATFWNFLVLAFISHLIQPWIPGMPDQPPQIQELWQNNVLVEEAQKNRPFFSHTYQSASYLYLYSGVPVYKLAETGRRDFYDFIREARPESQRIYVGTKDKFKLAPIWKEAGYQEVDRRAVGNDLFVVTLEK